MREQNELRCRKILMNNGRAIPALGFGTLIPDAAETITATRDALEAAFRHFDCAEATSVHQFPAIHVPERPPTAPRQHATNDWALMKQLTELI